MNRFDLYFAILIVLFALNALNPFAKTDEAVENVSVLETHDIEIHTTHLSDVETQDGLITIGQSDSISTMTMYQVTFDDRQADFFFVLPFEQHVWLQAGLNCQQLFDVESQQWIQKDVDENGVFSFRAGEIPAGHQIKIRCN